MSRNLSMPSKDEITIHWKKKYDTTFNNNFCWGCGFSHSTLHRAHLLAHCNGGNEHPDNLILLCKLCHYEIQEYHTNTKEEADKIKSLILEGMPFFSIRVKIYSEKIKLGLYDNFLIEQGFTKNDIDKIKLDKYES